MIHHQFGGVADRYIAEVLSEAMVPGEFKFFSELRETHSLDEGYPPEPAYLSTFTAAYIDRGGQGLRRVIAHGVNGRVNQAKYKDVVDRYQQLVGPYQQAAHFIEANVDLLELEPSTQSYGALGKWAIEAAQKDGKRLMAAHWISVTLAGKRVIDALIYPRRVLMEFPLIARQAFEPLALEIAKGATTIGGVAIDDDVKLFISSMMVQDSEASIIAGLPAATVLPPVVQFRQAARVHYKK